MDIKELRIGNVIYKNGIDYDSGGNKLLDIESSEIVLVTEDFLEVLLAIRDYEDFSGIQLTEEWLSKFGLKKSYDNWTFGKEICYETSWCGSVSLAPVEESNEIGYDLSVGYYSDKISHIKYVHQLQNLYFALTGEELSYSG